MNLLPQDALCAPPAAAAAAAVSPQAPAAWQRAWERAQALEPTSALQCAPAVPARPRDGQELEPCGMPAGAPEALGAAPVPMQCAFPSEDGASSSPGHARARNGRAPLRVHVDAGSGEGVRIWLGIDARPQQVAPIAAAALAQVRQALQASGHRVDLFVCNGQPLVAGSRPAGLQRRFPAPLPNSTQES